MASVKKVTKANVNELYIPCTPPGEEYGKAAAESEDFFLKRMRKNWHGIVVKDGKKVVGRAEFHPIEESFVSVVGENLYFMPCVWVIPVEQKKGYGRMLVEKVSELTRDRLGVATVAVDGWMPREFFEKMGFEVVEKAGPASLMLKKHKPAATCKWQRASFKHTPEPGKVVVDVVYSHQCPYILANYRSLVEAAKKVSDRVVVREQWIQNRQNVAELGEANIYVDGEPRFLGPGKPEEMERIVRERLEKLA